MKRTFVEIGLRAVELGDLELAEEVLEFISKRITKNLHNKSQRTMWIAQYDELKEAIDKAKSN